MIGSQKETSISTIRLVIRNGIFALKAFQLETPPIWAPVQMHMPTGGVVRPIIRFRMRMIEDTKKWVLSPERKAPKATREYAAHRLDTVLDKFLKTMQTTAARLQEKLLKPEVRQKGKEQVKEKARDSVLQLLNRLQAEQAQRVPGEQHTAEKSETRGDVY